MITLDEIQNISLRKSGLGGYKIEDVDSFIDKVIEKVKSLESSKRDLEQRIEAQDKEIQKYKEQEDSVQSALISAQMTAKQIVMEATKKSDEQLSESKEKADKLINDAKVRAEKINAETDAKTEEIMNKALRESSQKIEENNKILDAQKRSILRLMGEANKFKNSLLISYKEHLSLINAISKGNDLKAKKKELDKNYPAMKGNEPVIASVKEPAEEKTETEKPMTENIKEEKAETKAPEKKEETVKTETPENKADLGSGSKKKAEKGSDNNRKKIILDAEPTEVSFGAPASPSKKNEKGKK